MSPATTPHLPDVEHSVFEIIRDPRDPDMKRRDAGLTRKPVSPTDRIVMLRGDAKALADEIFDRESRLPFPPDQVCPSCDRAMS